MRTMPLQNPQLDGTTFSFSAGPTGLLLLHGLLATTAEVRPLGERLHAAGFSVSAPLLPLRVSAPAPPFTWRCVT